MCLVNSKSLFSNPYLFDDGKDDVIPKCLSYGCLVSFSVQPVCNLLEGPSLIRIKFLCLGLCDVMDKGGKAYLHLVSDVGSVVNNLKRMDKDILVALSIDFFNARHYGKLWENIIHKLCFLEKIKGLAWLAGA